jgi:hypothetical protein
MIWIPNEAGGFDLEFSEGDQEYVVQRLYDMLEDWEQGMCVLDELCPFTEELILIEVEVLQWIVEQ